MHMHICNRWGRVQPAAPLLMKLHGYPMSYSHSGKCNGVDRSAYILGESTHTCSACYMYTIPEPIFLCISSCLALSITEEREL